MSLKFIYRCNDANSSWYEIEHGASWDDHPITAFVLSAAQRDQLLQALRSCESNWNAECEGFILNFDRVAIDAAIALLSDTPDAQEVSE